MQPAAHTSSMVRLAFCRVTIQTIKNSEAPPTVLLPAQAADRTCSRVRRALTRSACELTAAVPKAVEIRTSSSTEKASFSKPEESRVSSAFCRPHEPQEDSRSCLCPLERGQVSLHHLITQHHCCICRWGVGGIQRKQNRRGFFWMISIPGGR